MKMERPEKSKAAALRALARMPLLAAALVVLGGCASVLSTDALRDAEIGVTVAEVQANPDMYRGRRVVWGGVIVSIEHLEDRTLIEVLQTELTGTHRPTRDLAGQGGRFLIEATGYIDAYVYRPERTLTVAGVIRGVETRKIGMMDYPYPVVSPLDMKLFSAFPDERFTEPVPPPLLYFPPYYDPYWPYYWPYYPYYPYR